MNHENRRGYVAMALMAGLAFGCTEPDEPPALEVHSAAVVVNGKDLVVSVPWVYQAKSNPSHMHVMATVTNQGASDITQAFYTSVSVNGSLQWVWSAGLKSGATLYLSKDFAISSGDVVVTADHFNYVTDEVTKANNQATKAGRNAASPPIDQWSQLGPRTMGNQDVDSTNRATGALQYVAVDLQQPGTLYVLEPLDQGGSSGPRIWKTTDSGVSWRPIGMSLPTALLGAIAVDPSPANHNRVFVTSDKGLFRSDDGGDSWRLVGTSSRTTAVYQPVAAGPLYTNSAWGPWNLGYAFTPQKDLTVTALGGFFNGTNTVYLYDRANGAMLASTSVTAANAWAYTAITPVSLQQDHAYSVAVFSSSGAAMRTDAMPKFLTDVRIDGSCYRPSTADEPCGYALQTSTMYGLADFQYTLSPDALTRSSTQDLIVDPSNSNILYATTSPTGGGVLRSTDTGATWSQLGSLPASLVQDLAIDPSNSQNVYAAVDNTGVFKLTGSTWTQLTGVGCGGTVLPNAAPYQVRVATASGGVVYAAYLNTANKPFDIRIFRGTNVGCGTQLAWTAVSASFGSGAYNPGGGGPLLYSSAKFPDDVYLTGIPFFHSSNRGASFTIAPPPPNGPHDDLHQLAVDAAGNIFAACDGGIYRSTDRGSSWTFIGAGIASAQFFSIADSPLDDSMNGGLQDNHAQYTDGTADWKEWADNLGDANASAIDPTNSAIKYASGQDTKDVYMRIGTNEIDISCGAPKSSASNIPTQILPDPTSATNKRVYLVTADASAIYSVTNPAFNPLKCSTSAPSWAPVFQGANGFARMAIDVAAQIRYACAVNGTLYATSSGGANPNDFAPVTLPVSLSGCRDLQIDPDDSTILYVAGPSNVLRLRRSTPGPGQRITLSAAGAGDVSGNLAAVLPGLSINTLAIDRNQPLTVYVGTDVNAAGQGGVYKGSSTDGGATWNWAPYQEGMPPSKIVQLLVNARTGLMRAVAFRNGIFEVATAKANPRTVQWTNVGNPFAARQITSCGDYPNEVVWALNYDGALFKNANHGNDASWVYVTNTPASMPPVVGLDCSGGRLYFRDNTNTLNQLTPSTLQWVVPGQPFAARDVAGFNVTNDYADWLYAVNTDNRFYRNNNFGSDSYWTFLGTLAEPLDIITSGVRDPNYLWARSMVPGGSALRWLQLSDLTVGRVYKQNGVGPSSIQSMGGFGLGDSERDLYVLDGSSSLWRGHWLGY